MTQQIQTQHQIVAGRVAARLVAVGDTVLLDGDFVRVLGIEVFDLAYHKAEKPIGTSDPEYDHRWSVLKFTGTTVNFVRFPHEQVTVARVMKIGVTL